MKFYWEWETSNKKICKLHIKEMEKITSPI